jgi:hypothetical protein
MNYLYKYNIGALPQKNSAFVGILEDYGHVYLLPNEDPEAELIGKWENSGELIAYNKDVYLQIRPLGNLEGYATGDLDLIHYQGHKQRHLQEGPTAIGLLEYPSDNQPCTLRITREKDSENGTWGFIVVSLVDDPNRSMLQRRIGIYNSSGDNLYYTVNFKLTDTNIGEDEEGNDIIVKRYTASPPPGQWTDNPEEYYFALMEDNLLEGEGYLLDLEEGSQQTKLFWENDQPWEVIDIDNDGNPDTTLVGSHKKPGHVTEDINSVNFDFTGDGNADYIIPK